MIDDGDFGTVQYGGGLIRCYIGVAMDRDLRIAGLCEAFENNGQRFISVDEYTAHDNLLMNQDATPASESTVWSRAFAPAVQSACVASSSSLWLTPSLHGTKIIAAGTTLARLQASWPAPELMRRWV